MVQQFRVPVGKMEPGDHVVQTYTEKEGGQEIEQKRQVVIGKVEMAALPYQGRVHSVVRVTGVDVARVGRASAEVVWMAVPDQTAVVTR